jgi:hypothetical protein
MILDETRDRTLIWTASLLVLMCVALAASAGTGEPGVRVLVRATARTSALFLCLALCSFPVDALARRRSALVRSLAVSHGLHLVVVSWLAVLTRGANLMERAAPVTVIGSVLAYAVIAAGAFRPRHPFVEWGLVWVAVSFLAAYGPRAAQAPLVYGPAVIAIAFSLVLRLVAPFVRAAAPVPAAKEDLAT